MPGMDKKSLDALMKIVQDPRYDQDTHIKSLAPAADLKLAVMAGGLVGSLNRAYGWKLPENGDWQVEQLNDIVYEIVSRPGYTLPKLIAAIKAGHRL